MQLNFLIRPALGFLSLCLFSIFGMGGLAQANNLYEVPDKGPAFRAALLARGADIVGHGEAGILHVAAEAGRLDDLGARLLARPFEAEPLGRALVDTTLGDYHTYLECMSALSSLVSTYPSLCTLTSLGTTIEGRSIPMLRIDTGNVPARAAAKPAVLYAGCLHARELMSVEMPLKMAEYLLANYATDPALAATMDQRIIHIAPMLNPDGHVQVEGDHDIAWWNWWRKNRRPNGDGTIGVDLNRNFSFQWGLDDIGSSPSTSSQVYRGTGPFSEPETTALRDYLAAWPVDIAFSYHSYGELLLYPWGYTAGYTADHELFASLGAEFTSTNGYEAGSFATGTIYGVNGDSDDWAYGETAAGKAPFLMFTPELNSYSEGGFGPPDTRIQPTFDLLLPMNLSMLELADEPRRVLGPVPPILGTNPSWDPIASELALDWSDNLVDDPNQSITWILEEFEELGHLLFDNAEAEDPMLWSYDGWSIDTAFAYNGSASYWGGAQNGKLQSLQMALPFRVEAGSNQFTFRTRYDIEDDYDYAYLQLSSDGGLIWENVAGNITTNANPNGSNSGHGITGGSLGAWVEATFDLSAWDGQFIELRLAYVTDGGVLEAGIWVDKIGPVAQAAATRLLAVAGTTSAETVSIPGAGEFSYRVRGIDAEADLGRWSNLETFILDPLTAVTDRLPKRSQLSANYPNPFNPSTLLPFEVAGERGQVRAVRLGIFDIQGRLIRLLTDEEVPAGPHRVEWDGRDSTGQNVAGGIYHARLWVDGEGVGEQKLVLLK